MAAQLSEDEKDRARIEALFERTFGALERVAAELGFDVYYDGDGAFVATKRESSSSADGSAR